MNDAEKEIKNTEEIYESEVTKENLEMLKLFGKIKKFKKIRIIASIVFVFLLVLAVGFSYLLFALNSVKHEDVKDVVKQEEQFETDTEDVLDTLETKDTELDWSDYGYNATSMKGVVNILLCGEEAMAESKVGARGRTDCIIIATINNNQKTLKLTSIMRDTYVKIPGYSNNKINASYAIGGMPLLLETVETNFGVDIDGYVLVNFNGFEKIIDALGGVNIELTEKEANYLNTTNYISEKKNRNVKAGMNLMNGNQALGYSRVRYVSTGTGLANDYGRNYRQRTVLEALFDTYKDSNVTDVITMLPKIMKLVTTDMNESTLLGYIANVLTLGAPELQTYKVPIDNYYKGARVRSMAVLYITDIASTRNLLHEFIFGTKLNDTGSISNYYGETPSKSTNNSVKKEDKSTKDKDKPTPKPTKVPDSEVVEDDSSDNTEPIDQTVEDTDEGIENTDDAENTNDTDTPVIDNNVTTPTPNESTQEPSTIDTVLPTNDVGNTVEPNN